MNVRELTPRKMNPTARPLRYTPDKFLRSFEAQVRYESGQIFHPQRASWLADFEYELLHFTSEGAHAHDDQVDVVSYAAQDVVTVHSRKTPRPFVSGGLRL